MSQTVREEAIIAACSSASIPVSENPTALPIARVLLSLSRDDEAVFLALNEIARIGLAQQEELRTRSREVEQLQGALASRVLLEQAKGVLFASGVDSMDGAFEKMRRFARSHSLRLHDVAARIVRGELRLTASGQLDGREAPQADRVSTSG